MRTRTRNGRGCATFLIVAVLAGAPWGAPAIPCAGYYINQPCAGGGDPAAASECSGIPGAGGPGAGQRLGREPERGGSCASCTPISGMPVYWVSEPFINLRIEDEPLGYTPPLGPRVSFQLSYRQRDFIAEEADIFGVGTNWSCSFRAYLNQTGDSIHLHRGGAGVVKYTLGVPHYRDRAIASAITNGFELEFPDGSKERYTVPFLTRGSIQVYFLSARLDPAGNALTFNYTTNANLVRLTSVTDADNRSTALYYEDSTFTNQITRVVDPFNRTNQLLYSGVSGCLTGIVDVARMTNSFQYDSGAHARWITNMVTPYGATGFRFGGVDADNDTLSSSAYVGRYVEVTLPNGGKELYAYLGYATFMSASNWPLPDTNPFPNLFDDEFQSLNNSFYWGPLQYTHLSTNDPMWLAESDYSLGRLRHWLAATSLATGPALALERAPSPDGSTAGQVAWYDYDGKSVYKEQVGTNNLPSIVALVLPGGATRFTHYTRGTRGQVTQEVSTYTALNGAVALRTNAFVYAGNEVDLVQHIGPNHEQVVTNYFNSAHQPLASHNALNEQTAYLYNQYNQLTNVAFPSGLNVAYIYPGAGSYARWLANRVEYDGSTTFRTNGFTYADGLVATRADERGLLVTNYYDALQRLTGVAYPDGTTTSNRYTFLDLTGAKDRLGHWTYFGYNSVRQKVAETNANGVVTRYDYCECGSLNAQTNAWGTALEEVTTFVYDYQGNRIYTLKPDLTITNWFDPLGRPWATGDDTGYRWFFYNNQGLLTTVSNVFGVERSTVFDNEDRPLQIRDANGVTVTNAFDDLGRVIARGYPDTGVERFGYSALGLVAYTNQIGNSNFFGYDAAGRKVAETNANGEILRFTNSPSGDLLSLTDGKDQTTRWHYNQYGLVTNKLDQTGAEILRYNYDPAGRLTNRWSAAKGNTGYAFDPAGNLTNIDYAVSPDVSLSYDEHNRLTRMVDASGTNVYAYRAGGQLWTKTGRLPATR